ncbi:MAG TPA: PD-(D/E)XK nuclease family protein, partial [Burkholderiales bacterium]|nr:PD-(D/E)XK nuclease family protein [Burkholderiales bacterium]
ESSGLAFDHLWVCGLTDEGWPLAPRPSPFLPLGLQKKAGIPEASAEGALAQDRRRTEAWLGAAPEVVLSHALREEDRELRVSVLIQALPEGRPTGPEGRPEIPAYPLYRDVLFAARALERQDQGAARAPALAQAQSALAQAQSTLTQPVLRGGARVLADQAACPFRAFARHRLGARALDEPVSGLDAAARGNLLHALMKGLWDELKTKQRLDDLPRGELAAVIERAARAAVNRIRRERSIEDGFAELERARLCRLAAEWLEVERARGGFEVAATEEKRTLQAGGLTLSGRIDRLDRLEGGGYALIDYKTGRPTPRSWRGPRPDDPQLPLYAVSAQEPISAVAFARLKTGDMRMMGFSRDGGVMPKVEKAINWPSLMSAWRSEVDALGSSFAAGEAAVDPKKGIQTCRNCDLAPLCRVHEKFSPLELEEEEGFENGEDAP